MKRQESTELSIRPSERSVARPPMSCPKGIRIFGLAALILMTLLVAPDVFADPADPPGAASSPITTQPPAAVVIFSASDRIENTQTTDHSIAAPTERREANSPDKVLQRAAEPPRASLASLLLPVDLGASSWKPATTDDVLAAAIAAGTNPDLEPLNPFRKRKRDLFVNERPVSIGRTDMLLRLRLRAKARKAMSVELHF